MSAEVPGSKATYKQSVEVAKSVNIRSLVLCKQLFYISMYSKVCLKKKENECYGTKKVSHLRTYLKSTLTYSQVCNNRSAQ